MKHFLLFTVLLLCSAFPAAAAGIDCSRAETPLEHAICDDPTLLQRDAVLSVAYETAIGGLSAEALATVQNGQRAWLDFVARACTEDGEPLLRGRYGEDAIQCLQNLYNDRISVLEGSLMTDGLRFYIENRYAAFVDPEAEADSFWRIAKQNFSAARLDGDNEEIRNFNRWRDEEVYAMLQRLGWPEDEDPAPFSVSSDMEATMTVSEVTPNLITLQVQDYEYPHGAAHGTPALAMLHYIRDEGRSLEASDIFDGEGWQERLASVAFNALQKQLGEYLMIEGPEGISESVTEPSRWTFSQTGLEIRFMPYEVTAYAFGMPQVSVPWDQITEYLTDGAANLTGGYIIEE